MILTIPQSVEKILAKLQAAGFEAFVVGGCVRDVLLGREPSDWDITTNARPEEIQKVFSKSLYLNDFGTVVVKSGDLEIGDVEITTYRSEAKYSDNRHPDEIKFETKLEKDLERRDFTINAMAYDKELVDLFKGQKDLDEKLIKAVGKADDRFQEDALRMLRAVRFAAQLNFKIAKNTWEAILKNKNLIKNVSQERIRDELVKMIYADNAIWGFWLLKDSGLLKIILPELEATVGVGQNKHHTYTVFFHLINSLQYCPSEKLEVRLAALFHDIAKPQTKAGQGVDSTFYNHEHLGTKMTRQIMQRLKFSNEQIKYTTHLVKNHMFFYSMGEITDAGVRRLLVRLGKDNWQDFLDLRIADRMGSGTQKEKPYKLIELEKRMEQVQKDPIDIRMLKLNGHDIIKILGIKPGPRVGVLVNYLLQEVIEDPKRNTKEFLEIRTRELHEELPEGARPPQVEGFVEDLER